jgi:hypothetical protein
MKSFKSNKIVSALLVGVIASSVSISAYAWSDREQGALLGLVIGAVAGSHVEQNNQRNNQSGRRYDQPSTVYIQTQPAPVYVQPRCGYDIQCTPVCVHEPLYNQWNQLMAYQLICR